MKENSRILLVLVFVLAQFWPCLSDAQDFGALAWAFATFSDKPSIPKINGKPLTPTPISGGQSSAGLLFPSGNLQITIEQQGIESATISPELFPAQSQIAVVFNSTQQMKDGTAIDKSEVLVIPARGEGKGKHFRLLYVGPNKNLSIIANGEQMNLRRCEPSKILNTGSINIEIDEKSFEIAPSDPEDLLVIFYDDRGSLKHMTVSDQNLVNPSAN